ncbi:hypothetical protein ACC732_36650, partial [Rhizobium ruizarguesonis]
SRLLRNAAVLDRIDELQNGAAKRTEKTVESLVADLDEASAFARQCGNPTALVSAIMAQAKSGRLLSRIWVPCVARYRLDDEVIH